MPTSKRQTRFRSGDRPGGGRGRHWSAFALLISTACWIEPAPSTARAGTGTTPPQVTGAERPRVEIITPPGVARLPVFSHAVRVGDILYLSGAIGTIGEELRLVEGGAGPETRQTLENIRTILAAGGATLEDVFKCTVFLADMEDYAAMNEVYLEYFPDTPPARSAMAGSGLALGARVEIECLALAPPD